jgi:hypothetical protein
MIQINLTQLKLYNIILSRAKQSDPIAGVLNGLIISLSGDANEFLGFIRKTFPSYTGHDLQHSWRIIKKVESIISSRALESLSSIEIFSLIIASAFHDVGMIKNDTDSDQVRKNHHILSEEFLNEYLPNRLSSISEYSPRLIKCIGFIAKSHGMTWEDLSSNEYFLTDETIIEQPLRARILSILLRVGDLLDIDSDRSCDPLRKFASEYFNNNYSNFHHERHKHITRFNYTPEEINIEVESTSKEDHTIWNEWFGYLKQDILHANTYVFKGSLKVFQLPKFSSKIVKAKNAKYELWTLRFEIDDKGRIWDVISQSIYTGKFDFVRELIQNSIDACLRWIYSSSEGIVDGCNPKYWTLANYNPQVIIAYSEKNRLLEIADNGVGMDKDSLKEFLFNVASSGYSRNALHRNIPFPSIAKFGIGFVSCLVRADKIIVKTKSRENKKDFGREVVLKTEVLDACLEASECQYGTRIILFLNKKYAYNDIQNYILANYYSTAVPIAIYNSDIAKRIIEHNNIADIKSISERISKISDIKSLLEPQKIDRKLQSPYLIVESKKHSFEDVIKTPVFIYLDKNFQVTSISDTYDEVKKRESISIALIPVEIYDTKEGIEWFSIHAFILKRKVHEKTLYRYKVFDKASLEKNVIILTQEEWENEKNFVTDNTENDLFEEEDEDIDEETHDVESKKKLKRRPKKIEEDIFNKYGDMVNYAMISEKNDTLIVREDLDDMISDEQYSFLINSSLHKNKAKLSSNPEEISEDENFIGNLDSLLEENLNGSLYQDGIKLPIKAWSIAPIGSCYAIANFFGNARFDLNVTRNAVNESHILLGNWASNIGKKIQENILAEVHKVFNQNKIQYQEDRLITHINKNDSDAIYEYCIEVLETLV